MPCIDDSFNSLRICIYTSDHRPSHVHVFGDDSEAIFNLNCPTGPIELRVNYGFKSKTLNGLMLHILGKVSGFCEVWRSIHGTY
jgi:hypothetical protein